MKWNVLLLTALIITTALSVLPPIPAGGRLPQMPSSDTREEEWVLKTHYVITAEDDSLLDNNQLLKDEGRFVFENSSFSTSFEIEDVWTSSLSPTSAGPPLVESGREAYLAYVKRMDWFNYSFRIVHSSDRGRTFDDEYVVDNAPSSEDSSVDIKIFRGELFYITSTVHLSGASELKVRRGRSASELPSAVVTVLSENLNGTRIESVASSGALMIFWKEGSTLRMGRFDGNTWTFSNITSAVAFTTSLASDEVFLYYTTGGGQINVVRSQDFGASWSTPRTVISLPREVNMVSVVWGSGRFHMVFNYRRAPLQILYSRSRDGVLWENPRVIATYSMNYQDGSDDLSIALYKENVTVAYENSSGRICLLNSTDSGNSWGAPWSFGDTHAHSPALHPSGRYLLYLEGRRLNICLLNRYQYTSTLRTKELYIPALKKIEDVALLSRDFSGNITFRLLSGGVQVYPQGEEWEVLSPQIGTLEGAEYTFIHHLDMNESLSLRGVILEMNLTRDSVWTPHIDSIIINYSTAFPFTEEFDDSLLIAEGRNISVISGRVHLLPGSERGYFLLGPVIPDGIWPANLKVTCSGMVEGDSIQFSLLDEFKAPLRGFAGIYHDSNISDNGRFLIRWNGKYLDSLPPSEPVYFRVDFLRGEGDPSLFNLTVDYSDPPQILSLSAGHYLVNRTATLELVAAISDPDDDVINLTVVFSYVDPSGYEGKEFLSSPFYSDGEWRAVFYPPSKAPTGDYVMVVRAVDPHGQSSRAFYMSDKIRVLNNRPTKPGISLNPPRPKGGDSIKITVVEPSTDVETDEANITYNYRYYLNGTLYEEHLNISQREHTLPAGIIKKHQAWKIEVRAYDGENESEPAVISFSVENSPPHVVMVGRQITIEEDSGIHGIPMNDIFMDWDGDRLLYSYKVDGEGINVDIRGDTLYIEPEKDFYGEVLLNLSSSDGENITGLLLKVVVTPVDDPPRWEPLRDITVMQDEWVTVVIRSWDVDGEHVVVTSNIMSQIEGLEEGVNYVSYTNGSFRIRPDNSMVGSFVITVSFSDSKTTLQDSFVLTVLNRDDPPTPPQIQCSLSEKYVFVGRQFTLYGSSSDPDELWGQNLRFTWYSSLEGLLGEGRTLNVTLHKVGHHTINLTVSDGNHTVQSSIDVWVVREPTKEPVSSRVPLLAATGALSVVLGSILAFLMFKRSKGEAGEEGEKPAAPEKKEEDTEISRGKIDQPPS